MCNFLFTEGLSFACWHCSPCLPLFAAIETSVFCLTLQYWLCRSADGDDVSVFDHSQSLRSQTSFMTRSVALSCLMCQCAESDEDTAAPGSR